MKIQALFLLIVFLSTPLVWGLPPHWRRQAITLISFCSLAAVAPFSLLLMLT